MKRKYLTADYRRAVEIIRENLPESAITTDVIVGFPGETDAEFQETVDFCKSIKFARIHVFPFSSRPGTQAAVMKEQVPDGMKRERTAKMLVIAKEAAAEYRRDYLGKTLEVLWEQQSSGVWNGYTGNYIKVYTKSSSILTNTFTGVKLVKLYRDGVWGENQPISACRL
jgi:threonylcarbamoyladenosine tRNA methylthiotransferase MtaB